MTFVWSNRQPEPSTMRPSINLLALAAFIFIAGCLDAPDEQAVSVEPDPVNTVWTVDLIRTLPGQQAEYLRNIEANWAGARRIARERGVVLAYQAFVAPPDSLRGWDVLLMTEYADSSTWAQREPIFESIFASPEYVRVPTAKPLSELREFLAGGVVMEALVSEPQR